MLDETKNLRIHKSNDKCISHLSDNERESIDNIAVMVRNALLEKDYNAVEQLTGYISSGDPAYITAHKKARSVIGRVDVYDFCERVLEVYLDYLKNNVG